MSKRHSEYERRPADAYYTPAWATRALLSVERFPGKIWEPACGAYDMARELGLPERVIASDIDAGVDFLENDLPVGCTNIITNPPFSLAQKFIERALALTQPVRGKVAMLLPSEFDTAKGRKHLFRDHPAYLSKHVLTDRIRWVNLPQKAAGPSSNHAWFVWDWNNADLPWINYIYGAVG